MTNTDNWLADLIETTYAWAADCGTEMAWFHIGALSGAEHEHAYYA